jgi:type IV secretory pathway VirB2 component (pilin)
MMMMMMGGMCIILIFFVFVAYHLLAAIMRSSLSRAPGLSSFILCVSVISVTGAFASNLAVVDCAIVCDVI